MMKKGERFSLTTFLSKLLEHVADLSYGIRS